MKKECHFHNYHKSHNHQYYYVSGRGESRVIVWEGLSLVVASFQKVNTKNAHSCHCTKPHTPSDSVLNTAAKNPQCRINILFIQ